MGNQQPKQVTNFIMNLNNFITSKKYYPLAANKEGVIMNTKTGNIRKPSLNKNGYYYIQNRFGGFTVHSIVADCFLENTKNLEQINHKDGVKTNNHVDNLEWVTRSENAKHAFRKGLLKFNGKCGEDSNLSKYTENLIVDICEELQKGTRNIDVSIMFGVPASYIKTLKAKKAWKYITTKYTFPVAKGK